MKKILCLLLICIVACVICVACNSQCEQHTYYHWRIKTGATCQSEGMMYRKCIDCNHIDKKVLPKLDHIMNFAFFEINNCLGRKYWTECSECFEDVLVDVGNSGNHFYDDTGVCVHCEAVYVPTSDEYFNFKLLNDGTYGIESADIANLPANLVIPALHDGVPVTQIESGAFQNSTLIESVTIGYNILTVGKHAFSDCTNLKTVTISDSVKSILTEAFANCTSLTSVTIGKEVNTIEKNAFLKCDNLKSAVFINHISWRVQTYRYFQLEGLIDSGKAAKCLIEDYVNNKWTKQYNI